MTAMVLFTLMLAGLITQISGASQVTPIDAYSSRPFTKRCLLKQFVCGVLSCADVLICVAQGIVGQYCEVFRKASHVTVYNIVDDPASRARLAAALGHTLFVGRAVPVVVAAWTLARWKGFEELIAALYMVRERGRHARLVILGKESDWAKLEVRVAELGLGECVHFPSHTPNPLKDFTHADVFRMSLRDEGVPSVSGRPLMRVANDCRTGPRELLQDGRCGYFVTSYDLAAIADAIEKVLDRPIAGAAVEEVIALSRGGALLEHHLAVLRPAA